MSIEFNIPNDSSRDTKLGVYHADAEVKGTPHTQMNTMVDHSESGVRKRAAAQTETRADLAQEVIDRIHKVQANRAAAAQGDTV